MGGTPWTQHNVQAPPPWHRVTHVDLGDGDVHDAAHHDEGIEGVPGVTEVVLGRGGHILV